MKPFLVIVFLLLNTISVCSQQLQLDSAPFTLTIVKHRVLPKIQTKELVKLGKDKKMFFVRVKLESNSGKKIPFDVNYFSLIVDKHKLRVRPIEADYATWDFQPISKVFKENHDYVKIYAGNIYDPSIPDTFYNFSYKDYKNIVASVNYGSNKEPMVWEYYYSNRAIKSGLLNLVFIVNSDVYESALYYGDQLVSNFTLKK